MLFFPTAVKVKGYCFQERPCQCLLNKKSHPSSLALSLSLSSVSLRLERLVGLESMRGRSVCRRLLWSEVHHWHGPSAQPPPWQPTAALAKAPNPLLPTPSCLRRNASGPGTANTSPLFMRVFFFPYSFMDEDTPDHFCLCRFLFLALGCPACHFF